jgi:hypothetical protein
MSDAVECKPQAPNRMFRGGTTFGRSHGLPSIMALQGSGDFNSFLQPLKVVNAGLYKFGQRWDVNTISLARNQSREESDLFSDRRPPVARKEPPRAWTSTMHEKRSQRSSRHLPCLRASQAVESPRHSRILPPRTIAQPVAPFLRGRTRPRLRTAEPREETVR